MASVARRGSVASVARRGSVAAVARRGSVASVARRGSVASVARRSVAFCAFKYRRNHGWENELFRRRRSASEHDPSAREFHLGIVNPHNLRAGNFDDLPARIVRVRKKRPLTNAV